MNFNKLSFILSAVIALTSMSASASLKEKLADRSANAALILQELFSAPDKDSPIQLAKESTCIMVIPSVTKIAFIGGARYGRGLVSCRTANAWSNPIFVSLSGGSAGFQAGINSTDLVLVFTRENAPATVSKGDLTLGGNVSVAAGPFGRDFAAGTDVKFDAEIYAYSRSRGLFAGIALDGSVIKPDKNANEEIFGDHVNPKDVILTPSSQGTPQEVQSFVRVLNSL